MINYISTRGNRQLNTFSEAILKGIAEDGGLFVPEALPLLSSQDLIGLQSLKYADLVSFVLQIFKINFPKKTIARIAHQAYGTQFDCREVAPVVHLKGLQYILELWHGPTAAFKDMALQIMPLFFSEAVKRENRVRNKNNRPPLSYLILVATSGDTGKAALEGYKDKDNIFIVVFYPDKLVSQVQQLQMITQDGSNVAVFALQGNFDQAQTVVKQIFADRAFNEKLLSQNNILLSSANSINWGRLIPQIAYHIHSYVELIKKGVLANGEEMDVVIPTGNFGNILSAFYAKKMGLPIRKLVCASNENNVLTRFLQTGLYDVSDLSLIKTPSPSMDILIASNIERLLYEITHDAEKVNFWMEQLHANKKFAVDSATLRALKKYFWADWVSNRECLQNIQTIYEKNHYLFDPHTSVAQLVAQRYIDSNHVQIPVMISSTAHWAKFTKEIYPALQLPVQNGQSEDEFAQMRTIGALAPSLTIPATLSNLHHKKILHSRKCSNQKGGVERLLQELVDSM